MEWDFNHLSPKRDTDSLQAQEDGYLHWSGRPHLKVLQHNPWGDSLPGYLEPANPEQKQLRKAQVLCPAVSPAVVQVTPARTLLLGPKRRTPSAKVPVRLYLPLYPCLQEALKIVTGRYTQERKHGGTCRVNAVKPECSQQELQWAEEAPGVAGSWISLHWGNAPGEARGTSNHPHRPQCAQTCTQSLFVYFRWTVHLQRKKGHFWSKMSNLFFFFR